MTQTPDSQGPVEQAPPAPPRKKPDSTRMVIAILGAVVVVTALVLVFSLGGGGSKDADPQAASAAGARGPAGAANAVGSPQTAPAAPAGSREVAGALRRAATVACRGAEWDKCKADLDEAARVDPAGESVTPVQRMRQMIEHRGGAD